MSGTNPRPKNQLNHSSLDVKIRKSRQKIKKTLHVILSVIVCGFYLLWRNKLQAILTPQSLYLSFVFSSIGLYLLTVSFRNNLREKIPQKLQDTLASEWLELLRVPGFVGWIAVHALHVYPVALISTGVVLSTAISSMILLWFADEYKDRCDGLPTPVLDGFLGRTIPPNSTRISLSITSTNKYGWVVSRKELQGFSRNEIEEKEDAFTNVVKSMQDIVAKSHTKHS